MFSALAGAMEIACDSRKGSSFKGQESVFVPEHCRGTVLLGQAVNLNYLIKVTLLLGALRL